MSFTVSVVQQSKKQHMYYIVQCIVFVTNGDCYVMWCVLHDLHYSTELAACLGLD